MIVNEVSIVCDLCQQGISGQSSTSQDAARCDAIKSATLKGWIFGASGRFGGNLEICPTCQVKPFQMFAKP